MRKVTYTYYGYDRPDIIVTIDDHEYRGELRAWAIDDDTGDWWANVQYRTAPGSTYIRWLPANQVRRDADLTDDDGRVNPGSSVAGRIPNLAEPSSESRDGPHGGRLV